MFVFSSVPESALTRILGLPTRGVLTERYTCTVCTPEFVLVDIKSCLSGMPYSNTFYLRQRLKCVALNKPAALGSYDPEKEGTETPSIQIDFEFDVIFTESSFWQVSYLTS